jgi:hypothetical protein
MAVEDVTAGVQPANSIRLRGHLLLPSDQAYDAMAEGMRPLGRTPLLRRSSDGNREEVLALPVTYGQVRPAQPWRQFSLRFTVLSCSFRAPQMVPGLESSTSTC